MGDSRACGGGGAPRPGSHWTLRSPAPRSTDWEAQSQNPQLLLLGPGSYCRLGALSSCKQKSTEPEGLMQPVDRNGKQKYRNDSKTCGLRERIVWNWWVHVWRWSLVISRGSGLILVCPCIRIHPSWADKTSILPLFQ